MVEKVAETWCVDPGRVMLTGMSDGGTFTMICGLQESVPFTHLAPISGVLAPLDSNARRRVAEKPVYLVHGGRDWMFPWRRRAWPERSSSAAVQLLCIARSRTCLTPIREKRTGALSNGSTPH